ncbi:shikimate kinase [Paenibacillus sp. NPDC058174]|uniref:shikimate kinase n=1 Tax=Paenibacillus sp. NPDC058174 TaxID=3346366 RepID=UPI0036DCD4FB
MIFGTKSELFIKVGRSNLGQEANGKIVLVGFMGTGKSTVSRLLADKLGWARYDSDEEIERLEGRKISDIFAAEGEAGFRAIESKTLISLLEAGGNAIIATGGGAVLLEGNRSAMLDNSFVVALKADAEHIISRVKSDTSRPLLQGDVAANVNRIMEARKHAYDFAHLQMDTTALTANEAAEAILLQLHSRSSQA